MAGLSPTEFIKQKLHKIAVINFPYTGHLLALGIMPYVGVLDRKRDLHRLAFAEHIPYQLSRSKSMNAELWRTNLDVLAKARPEVSICSEYEDAVLMDYTRQLAPTVVIGWNRLDWRGQFREVAHVIGMRREAERWLSAYEMKAERARALLRPQFGTETLTVLHLMLGQLLVYGGRNAGAVLFGDLGLNPAYQVEDMKAYRIVAPDELASYTGDRVLLIVDADPASAQAWETLQQSDEWRNLAAVRHGRVYEQHEMPWLDYSPFAHNLIIDRAVALFGGS
jgi:AraC family transcriptional regulator, transcriptional activator for feuABC-ybbA operon